MNEAHPLLKDTGSGLTIFYKGKYLYSSKHPRAGAVKLAAAAPLLPATLVLVPSIGLGYGLPELLERLPPRCHVLCVEHDPELRRLAEERVLPLFAGDTRISFVGAEDLAPILGALERLSPGAFRRVAALPLCGAARLHPEFYRDAESLLSKEIQTFWQNKMTLIHLGLLYVKNLFANLPLLPRARDAAGLSEPRPIIVIGAGPSLPQALPLVRALRDRAALLTVDTALAPLLDSGLVPDYIVALEPQFVNIGDFHALGRRAVPLLADLSSSPQVIRFCLEKRNCPLYFFSSVFQPLELWERLRRARLRPLSIPPLGSVGVAAVYLALRLTRRPVFLAGLDFSYPHRRTHAPGSPGDLLDLSASDRRHALGQREFAFFCERPRLTLPGKKGIKVESDLVFSSYAQNLAALSRQAQRVFDLDPEGLELGAPLLETDAAAAAVLERTAAGNAPAEASDAPASPWSMADVRNFLAGEECLMREANEILSSLIGPERPLEGVLDDERFRILKRADFAYAHLPVRTALPGYTQASALQALLPGKYLLERIGRAEAAVR